MSTIPVGHFYYKDDPNADNAGIKIYRVLGGDALPAGLLKVKCAKQLVVYQHINDISRAGQIFVRELEDFNDRMLPFPPDNWNPTGVLTTREEVPAPPPLREVTEGKLGSDWIKG